MYQTNSAHVVEDFVADEVDHDDPEWHDPENPDAEEVEEVDDLASDAAPPPSARVGHADEYKMFQTIDREQEDALIVQYHRTNDTNTLLQLLNMRDQTLHYMAMRYAYLDNEDDMYCEFKGVWLKCVKRYDSKVRVRQARGRSGALLCLPDGSPKMISKKTPFNTYLYTSMLNRVWNILKHRHSKRLLDGNGNPVASTMRSLDYAYGEKGDMTLKDVLPDHNAAKASSGAEMSDIMRHLGADDPDIRRTVDNFIKNPRFGTLTAACNYRVGTLRISKWDKAVLEKGLPQEGVSVNPDGEQKAKDYLRKMVDSTGLYKNKYEVVSFVLQPSRVDFVIHMDDPKVLKKVKEAVSRCQRSMAEHAQHA